MNKLAYDALIALQPHFCGICGGSIEKEIGEYLEWREKHNRKRTKINLDIDHRFPKSKARGECWKNELTNLQLSHRTCNNQKGNDCPQQKK